jgi:hypothetical protein
LDAPFYIADPMMETGQRDGNKVFITKVPYNPSHCRFVFYLPG